VAVALPIQVPQELEAVLPVILALLVHLALLEQMAALVAQILVEAQGLEILFILEQLEMAAPASSSSATLVFNAVLVERLHRLAATPSTHLHHLELIQHRRYTWRILQK
jgi:hypothetical protein